MRIGLVSPYDLGRAGGVQDQVIRLAGWLSDAGHDPVVVGPGVEGPEGAILLGPTTTITANRAKAPVHLDPRVRRRLVSAVGDVDVLHVHEPLMPAVSTAAMGMKGPAKVATFHADPPPWVRRLYRYGRSGVRAMLRNASVVTVTSPVSGSSIDGIVHYRIIPNGIDVADYSTGPKDALQVAFLGRDDERKGLSVLLAAWAEVRSAVPGAHLTVVGADRGDGADGVEYLGRVDEATKREVLAAASLFCAPNLGGESFGIILAEAMASGCAIVASGIPAFEHVAGPTARLCAPGDVGALAREIAALLAVPAEARRLGGQAAERVVRFDGATVAAQFIAAYEDAIADTPGR
jgi:phosphatidylinositol alpha-mannosyltransferase